MAPGQPPRPTHSLPVRPAFASSSAGQPQQYAAYPQTQGYVPQVQPGYYPYPQQQFAGYQPNIAGGYPSGGFFPQMYGAASYGQSLFRPAVNPEGYAYSSAYLTQTQENTAPAAKRPRTNHAAAEVAGSMAKPWRNCCHPGCKFVGSGEQVEIHEEDRHLIFAPGKTVERSEEEERFAKRKGPPPPIEGTGITLNTPEDIEKWIAQRKARWPTANRVKEKAEERQASIARGEMPANGRNRKKQDAATLAEEWGKEVGQYAGSERRDGGRERGRGGARGRGGTRGRGGRGGLVGQNGHDRPKLQETVTLATAPEKITKPSKVTATDAVLSGLGGYDTSSDSTSDSSDSDSDSSSSSSASEDGSQDPRLEPGEVPESKATEPAKAKVEDKIGKPICKFFAQSGRCKFNERCRFAHISANGEVAPPPATGQGQDKKKQVRQPPPKRHNAFERPSMLGALLANPIQNTLSQLSQTIRFLVANDLLDNVELRPGQAEEEERERNKVIVLEETDESEVVPKKESDTVMEEVKSQLVQAIPDEEAVEATAR